MGSKLYVLDVHNATVLESQEFGEGSMVFGIDALFNVSIMSNFDRPGTSFSVRALKDKGTLFWTSAASLVLPSLTLDCQQVHFCIKEPTWRSEVRGLPFGERRLFLPYAASMAFCNKGAIAVQLLTEPHTPSELDHKAVVACWHVLEKRVIGLLEVDSTTVRLAGAASVAKIAIIRSPRWDNPRGRIDVYSLETFEVVAQVDTGNLAINSAAISPLGDFIIASVDGEYSQAIEFQERQPSELYYAALSGT